LGGECKKNGKAQASKEGLSKRGEVMAPGSAERKRSTTGYTTKRAVSLCKNEGLEKGLGFRVP